jgi:hypothetical protein
VCPGESSGQELLNALLTCHTRRIAGGDFAGGSAFRSRAFTHEHAPALQDAFLPVIEMEMRDRALQKP